MFSDYCPIILAEVSKGDVIEFLSGRNEEKVGFPFWMYYPSAEVHRAYRLAGPAAGAQPCQHRSERNTEATAYYIVSGYRVRLSLKALFPHIVAIRVDYSFIYCIP